MTVATEVLRRLDPRKSYDRGPWTGAAEVPQPAPSNGALAALSTAELRQELERRVTAIQGLTAKRERIAAELAEVEAEIAALSGEATGDGAARKPARHVVSRPKNSLTLAEAIAAAVEPGEQVSPADVADLVRKGGFMTTSKSFAQAVAVALAKHPGFQRVDRGRYERVG